MNDADSAEHIERDIERTRAGISRTLNDLQQRLSPSFLIGGTLGSAAVGDALRSVRSGTADFAANLGRAMSRNPLPVLLTGIGFAWLIFSRPGANRERPPQAASYDREPTATMVPGEGVDAAMEREDPSRVPVYELAEDESLGSRPVGGASSVDFRTPETGNGSRKAGNGAGDGGHLDNRTDAEVTEQLKAAARKPVRGIGQRAEHTRGSAASVTSGVGHVSHTLSRGVERVTGAIKGGGDAAYRTAKDVAETATSAVRRAPASVGSAARSAGSFIQENPVISGAAALILGAALALMIPPSRRERQLIGEASDEVRSSVRQAVKEKVERAKDVVASAAEAAADVARKEARGTGGEPAGTAAAAGETAEQLAR